MGMYRYTVKINGMVCDVCAEHISEAIKKAFNVSDVSCSHKKGEAVFDCAEDITKEKMTEVIESTGYNFKSISKSNASSQKGKSSFFSFLKK